MVRVPIGPPKRDPRESQVVGTEHSWDAPANAEFYVLKSRQVGTSTDPASTLICSTGYCRLGDIECACDGFGPDDRDRKRASCPNWDAP